MTIDFVKRPTKNNQTNSLSAGGTPSLRFKNKDIFGDTFDAYWLKAQGHVMSLLLSGKINKDGTVTGGELSELWSYIYLLYLSNKNYDVFDGMRGRRGPLMSKATAKRFIKVIKDHMKVRVVRKETLIDFINDIVTTKKPVNPLESLLMAQAQTQTPTQTPSPNRDLKERLAKSNAELQECMVKVAVLEERLAKSIARPPPPPLPVIVAKSIDKQVANREKKLQEKVDALTEKVKFLKSRLTLLNAQKSPVSVEQGARDKMRLSEALSKISQLREKVTALKEYPAQVMALQERLTKSNGLIEQLTREMGVAKPADTIPLVRVFKDRMRYLEDSLNQRDAMLDEIRKILGASSNAEIIQKIRELKASGKKPNIAWGVEKINFPPSKIHSRR